MGIRDLNLTVLVNSCDAYEDLWDLFFAAYDEYASHLNLEIVLNLEVKNYYNKSLPVRVHSYVSHDGVDHWGGRLLSTLHNIETDYVLMVCEDFILEAKVGKKKIEDCIDFMDVNFDSSVIYISDVINTTNSASQLEELPKMMNYKINTAPAIWRRSDLIRYLDYDDNPWAWEFFGSFRSYFNGKKFYQASSNDGAIYSYNSKLGGAIYRGKWVEDIVVDKIKRYKLNIDLSIRGVVDYHFVPKRNFLWKVKFFYDGYKMIGFWFVFFLFRSLKDKLLIGFFKK